MIRILRRLFRDRKGVALIEYAFLAALVSTAFIGAATQLGGSLDQVFTNISLVVSPPPPPPDDDDD